LVMWLAVLAIKDMRHTRRVLQGIRERQRLRRAEAADIKRME